MCSVCVCVSVDGQPVICKHRAACSTGGVRNVGMLQFEITSDRKLAESLGGSQVSTESSVRTGENIITNICFSFRNSTETQVLGGDNEYNII